MKLKVSSLLKCLLLNAAITIAAIPVSASAKVWTQVSGGETIIALSH